VSTGGVILVALAIAVGLAGIVVPLLPGTLLVFAAIAVWAIVEHTVASWVTLALVTVLLGASIGIKYLWPVRRMRRAEVSSWSLLAGAVLGIVGFFVVPVLGIVIGFVLGIFLAELVRLRTLSPAWASTLHALKAVVLSVGVELTGALLAATVWALSVAFW